MNAPTLLVGLGGTGCKVIAKVSALITEEQREKIALAAFDTDINELRAIQRENPFIKIVQTSTKQTVGEYLKHDQHARDTWFPVNAILNGKALSEGAGQVRSISRLAFDTAIRAGKLEPLHEAIQSLYRVEEDKVDQALRVVIVSSLAGGTGSGLILPVGLYIKNYLKTRFHQSANITRGFFLLPEIFYEVIVGQSERNNLKSNAYATLRELDAFMMKGDATLPERYKDSVKMEFPRVASDGYEEYDIRPYDFCFLFDAQNANGGNLNDFEQYLDHAASCIYAQSIGPMNKRSNSSEDNTIRKLAKERGRNRYAGAGSSMMIYPFEDIRSFIALKWARETVSKQWLVYDNEYKQLRAEYEKRKADGFAAVPPSADEYYATAIETQAKQRVPFASAIVLSCSNIDPTDGVTKLGDRWNEYIGGLTAKIENDVASDNPQLTNARFSINANRAKLGTEWKKYVDFYYEIEKYRQMVFKRVEEIAPTIAYSMFHADREFKPESKQPFELETYLVDSENKFLHPNAIRYFLFNAYKWLENCALVSERQYKDALEFFETFVQNTFDDPSTEKKEEVTDLKNRKVSIISTWRKHPTGDQTVIADAYKVFLDNVDTYEKEYTKFFVYREGSIYLQKIIKAFEGFYRSFDTKVATIDERVNSIYRKYKSRPGSTTRYVCASSECLDHIYSKMTYTGSSISIDHQLAKDIYYSVLNYATMKEKPANNRYFSELFDKGILGYFEKRVMQDYGSSIDLDIITALEKEAEYTIDLESVSDVEQTIEEYIRKTIRDTRALSCPFIEKPTGEMGDPIYACTFNTEIVPDRGDESGRAQLVRKELLNSGAAPDDDISKYMILFYQAYYGLRANDLSKFAPPENSPTYVRNPGEYFKAYFELISGIHPTTHLSTEISPHIDRWWHIITKMPDLDESNQEKQEREIYAAFFWGIIGRYIVLSEDGNERIYRPRVDTLRMDDERDEYLIVSNGTACDKLYEVLDAIAIYPALAKRILSVADAQRVDDINDGKALSESTLFKQLRHFSIEEPRLGIASENNYAKSIFSLPLMMKKSITPEKYHEMEVIHLLRAIIEELRSYLSNFCTQKEMPDELQKLIMDQFEKYLSDVEIESKVYPTIYRESLFDRTCSNIANALQDIGFRDKASEIMDRATALRDKAIPSDL